MSLFVRPPCSPPLAPQMVETRESIKNKLWKGEYLTREYRGRSLVWNNFLFVTDHAGSSVNYVSCKLCGEVFSYRGHCSGTSTLKKHMARCQLHFKKEEGHQHLLFQHPVITESQIGLSSVFANDRKDEATAGGSDLGSGNVIGGDSLVGICDDVSIPVSPQQFLVEEADTITADTSHASQRPESYKLRHNNHLSLVLESLAGDESFMDVTLTAQGKSIKAHKSVLSAVSPYFRGVLKENPCQHPIIIMPRDIKFEELHSIISYVYKGEMTVAAEDLASLLKTAEVLQVTGLTPSEAMNGFPGHIQTLAKSLSQASSPSTSTPPITTSGGGSRRRGAAAERRWTNRQKAYEEAQEEIQARVDPTDFLNADMTLIKEEVDSDDEMGEDPLSASSSRERKGDKESSEPPSVSGQGGSYPPPEDEEKDPLSQDPLDSMDPAQDPLQFGDQDLDASTTTVPPAAFLCPHCLETHRPLDALRTHLRVKHPSKAAHVCKCGRVFLKTSLLGDHQRKCGDS